MKNFRKIALLLVFLLAFSSISLCAYGEEKTADVETEKTEEELFQEKIDFLERVIGFVLSKYEYDVDYDKIIDGLYDGFFSVLDDYSIHYTSDEYNKFDTDLSGEFIGIGIHMVQRNGQIVVISPLQGTPALEAGIKPNDIIVSVDGTNVVGYTTGQASKLIKGEKGTSVKIGIKRDGEVLYFDIVRDTIVLSSVSSKVLENNKGYLKISQFNHNTCELVKEELKKFDELNVTDIVIDLRNNPGGSLDEVVDVLNLFVPKGDLVYVKKPDNKEEIHRSKLNEAKYNIAVLVNGGSASASEVFAGAVQDRDAGKIIGTKTYGKGVVQTLYPLKNGHAVKFTTAEYFTPNRNKVQGIGITPDIIVKNKTGESTIDLSEYPELKKTRKPSVGVVGLDVLGAEMILHTLGYEVNEPDGIFDEKTFEELAKFQKDNGLSSYGILDFITQDALTVALNDFAKPNVEDLQLKEALKLFE